jgi:Tfp pilus assembly protein PilF
LQITPDDEGSRPVPAAQGARQRHPLAWVVLGLVLLALIITIWTARRRIGAEEALSMMDRGIALLEQYDYLPAYELFDRLARAFPAWEAAHVNRGLAAFNLQADDYLVEAERAYRSALQLRSDSRHALVSLGILFRHKNEIEAALDVFGRAAALDPEDPYILYQLGATLADSGRFDEAKVALEKTVRSQPSFFSAWNRLMGLYARLRQQSEREAAFAEVERLNNPMALSGIRAGVKYGEGGKYNMAIRNTLPPGVVGVRPPPEAPQSPAIAAPRPFAPAPLESRRPDGAIGSPGMAIGDITGDGSLEVVLCSQKVNDEPRVVVYSLASDGSLAVHQEIADGALLCALGDLDGDLDLDLVLAGRDGLRALANDGGRFLSDLPLGAARRQDAFPVRLYVLDLDADWDLDVACLWQESEPGGGVRSVLELLNNNRDGTFRDIAEHAGIPLFRFPAVELAFSDWDGDIDLDLLVLDGQSGRPWFFANDRAWKFRSAPAPGVGDGTLQLSAPGVHSIAGADLDGDGKEDIVLFSGGEVRLWRSLGDLRFEEDEAFFRRHGALGGSAGVVFDFRSALAQSLLILDGKVGTDGSRGMAFIDGPATEAIALPFLSNAPAGSVSALAALLGTEGRPQLLVYDAGGARRHDLETPGTWLALDLRGPLEERLRPDMERSNPAGIGAAIELRAGGRSAVYRLNTGSGGTARAAARLYSGLSGANAADYARILWPDGILQSEIGLAAGRLHVIEEVERKPSSCPVLFAWNGSEFEFVADFLGVGGLGYLVEPGVFGKPDPTELLLIPRLEPAPGARGALEYQLRVLEPLEECTYLDQASLVAVDHPAEIEVLPLELFAVSAPPPAYEILAFRGKLFPRAARDGAGREVTERLLAVDGDYAPELRRDRRFPGLLVGEHVLELEFGEELDRLLEGSAGAPGEVSGRPVLFLHGYIEYGYSTSNFAAWQAGVVPKAPTFSVERRGRWVPLRENWGFPAGYPRWMAVDLDGLLEAGDRKIRIATNLEIGWDQAFLARAWPASGLTVHELDADSAELGFRGFPAQPLDGTPVEGFLYRDFLPRDHFRAMPGSYTRYGDVRELLESADDRFVILGPGDELSLSFRADRLPVLAPGERRTFFWKCAGYCKDMDLYTAHPEGVEPLPFRAMQSYPYAPGESYPETSELQRYRATWNTRVVEATPLTPAGPPGP